MELSIIYKVDCYYYWWRWKSSALW
uniref:Uncharacterized protein n=1 Tax=Arundo donax TaxID=35708 RepID=A0A0A8Y3P2_ARUDO